MWPCWSATRCAICHLHEVRYTRYRLVVRYNPNIQHRRSIRLSTWDYRDQGAYFVTICTYRRECVFEDDTVRRLVEQTWTAILWRSRNVGPDLFVVMPNHVHGIIWITPQPPVGAQHPPRPTDHLAYDIDSRTERRTARVGAAPLPPATRSMPRVLPRSLGAVMRTFKAATTKRINEHRLTAAAPVWQRNYYERVIRDEVELARARQYILDNPAKWAEDKHNPANLLTTIVVGNRGVRGAAPPETDS